MMSNKTTDGSAFFGHKAQWFHNRGSLCSTVVHSKDLPDADSLIRCDGKYESIDYADKRKTDIYRGLNQMLGEK